MCLWNMLENASAQNRFWERHEEAWRLLLLYLRVPWSAKKATMGEVPAGSGGRDLLLSSRERSWEGSKGGRRSLPGSPINLAPPMGSAYNFRSPHQTSVVVVTILEVLRASTAAGAQLAISHAATYWHCLQDVVKMAQKLPYFDSVTALWVRNFFSEIFM